MSILSTPLRKQLEKCIREARIVAEDAAADSIRRMAVAPSDPPAGISAEHKALRVRLRAHGRTLGDTLDAKRVQTTARLQEAAAYEIWHRMLFGRFLVERGLLLHPDLAAPLTLAELAELAPDEGAADAWTLAERYAADMLPAVFKPDDPVLALPLDPYHHNQLQGLVTGLDFAVFEASDSLGWTYQFWRAAEKDAINDEGRKIGAAELPAVTQLFTEAYMVRFLLHNTLGAWWAGKVLSADPDLARDAADEAELRIACAVPEIEWEYLRFVRDPAESGLWRPAAGSFPGWPDKTAAITLLDPCCGSGHFLVEALLIFVALRKKEEGLSADEVARLVLRDNLHGLEIDVRCLQIAAFAVALAAWRIAGGPVALPGPHLAWVGAPPPMLKAEMAGLGTGDAVLSRALETLHDQFVQAPLLGSLLEIGAKDLLDVDLRERGGEALARLRGAEPERAEGAVAVGGLFDAAALLGRFYTLQVTNVPFLGRGKQAHALVDFIERQMPEGKTDLATAMLLRMQRMSASGGTVACVTPQNWLFLGTYKPLRERLLTSISLSLVAGLGSRAFDTISGEVVNVALVILRNTSPEASTVFGGLDANEAPDPNAKAALLYAHPFEILFQSTQRKNPDARIIIREATNDPLLAALAGSFVGFQNGDRPRWVQHFWEQISLNGKWFPLQMPVNETAPYGGRDSIILWEGGIGALAQSEGVFVKGREAWGKRGVLVRQMSHLPVTLYDGDLYDQAGSVIVPKDQSHLSAVWAFCSSSEFNNAVRKIDRKMNVTNATMVKVPFNLDYWKKVATETYPNGLPAPYSDDPTQWLFHGHPAFAKEGTELHVALARLAGYRWPAESNMTMHLSPLAKEHIKAAASLPQTEGDGLLPLHGAGQERPLADRLRALLAVAFGKRWSNALEAALVRAADTLLNPKTARDTTLDSWLHERAFRQHCKLFSDRPFLWQITDGIRGGFGAFLHYHRLDHATLEKLTYTVLGDWLARAKAESQTARAERARTLQQKLEAILEGKEPYDIFVRWKHLAAQPMGWEPDLDDGVRQNIRPFILAEVLTDDLSKILKDKDRGNEVASAPWYPVFDGERRNDHHTSLTDKQAARAQR